MSGRVGRGLLAGAAGGAAMTVSSTLEMRLRGRDPSVAPIQPLEKALGLDLSRDTEERLVTVGHLASSGVLGAVRGLLGCTPLARPVQEAVFTAVAFSPDFVLIPTVGEVPAPWRWSALELALSTVHHTVYAVSTIAVFRVLEARA